ncbi:MAG: TrkA family potassium uptake protein [Acidimicrobiia bacterium]
MRIVIAGCGRVGSDLAKRLTRSRHDVSIIDVASEGLTALGTTFNGTTHTGLAYDVDTLKEAGIEDADAFIAVTNSDNANLMAVEVAKEVFDVPRALARLDDPARERAYRALSIDYVAASAIVSKVIYESIVEDEFRYHLTFAGGDVEVVEMVIGNQASRLTVGELEEAGSLRVAAVRRQQETLIPSQDSELEPNDLVVAAVRRGTRSKVKKYLAQDDQ